MRKWVEEIVMSRDVMVTLHYAYPHVEGSSEYTRYTQGTHRDANSNTTREKMRPAKAFFLTGSAVTHGTSKAKISNFDVRQIIEYCFFSHDLRVLGATRDHRYA